ncbi:MAG: hypothetical protein BGO47_05865 [Microbacterium sp. 67-17]|nr:MAG: hypothetical protein BGO47_05865 [Microbacterium sp. 67-17]
MVDVVDVMRAVAVMADWRLVRTFRCEAVVVADGQERHYELHAEPNHSSYVCKDLSTGRISAYVDSTHERIDSDTPVPYRSSDLLWHPLPTRLAFPFTLPIWGRKHDGYRMMDADESAEALIVRLAGQRHSSSGTLTVDLTRGLATRFEVPELVLEYRDLEPAPNRLRDGGIEI